MITKSGWASPESRPVRRAAALIAAALALSGVAGCQVTLDAADPGGTSAGSPAKPGKSDSTPVKDLKAPTGSALAALKTIPVKGRAASTGYSRDEFGSAWTDTDNNGCDQRNDVLRRDLTGETLKPKTRGCVVLSGTLADPYTGATIAFRKESASAVQIDHVVALQNAWVTGAFRWTEAKRTALATDPLNLLAVDGPTNSAKGAGDAATWLPRKAFRCAYVARQIADKVKYGAWMTAAEHKATERVLAGCPDQKLPQVKTVPLGKESGAGADAGKGDASAGAFCSPVGAKGVTDAGTPMVCSSKNGDPARWRSAEG
jgi:hypothetical protein